MAHRTSSGSWKVRWRDYGEGVMRARTFQRKVDAVKFEAEMKLGRALGEAPAGTQTNFQEFSKRWYEQHCLTHKAKSQWVEDARIIARYHVPAFGYVSLDDLKRSDLQQLQQKLVKSRKLKPKTINNIVCLAKKILADAVAWGLLDISPFEAVRRLPVPKQPFKYWEPDELKRFLNFCQGRDFELWRIVALTSNTGLRLGELQALRRDCLDFENRFLTVKRNYVKNVKEEFDTTKGKDFRYIEINALAMAALKDKVLLKPLTRIFDYPLQAYVKRRLRAMCVKAGVRPMSVHGLRHTFATHLAYAEVSPYDIQRSLGHTDINTTQRYVHLALKRKGGITTRLDSTVPAAVPG
jgi:integrase